jgi:hypothetical protein
MIATINRATRMPRKFHRPPGFYHAEVSVGEDCHVIFFESEGFALAAAMAELAAKELGGRVVAMTQHESEQAREFFLQSVL